MEDIKKAKSVETDGIVARFVERCKRLSINDERMGLVMKLFNETKGILLETLTGFGNGTSEEAEQYWFAGVLFVMNKLNEKNADSSSEGSNSIRKLNLCQILRVTNLSIADFFKELPHFIAKVYPVFCSFYGADWQNRLEVDQLMANYAHMCFLSQTYKRACKELFQTSDSKEDKKSDIANASSYTSEYQRLGWLLFLALRVHAFNRFRDLISGTNGVVSVLAIMVMHVPTRFRNFNITERFVKKGDKGVDLIGSLCGIYNTTEEDLKLTLEKANGLIVELLKKKPIQASECNAETLQNIDTDGLIYFDDLLEESSLSNSIKILEKDYDDAACNQGELDERIFIIGGDSLLVSGSQPGCPPMNTGVKRKFDLLYSPTKTNNIPLSPIRSPLSHANGAHGAINSKMAATPVSMAMTTAKWLRTAIAPLPSKPSADLERHLASCDKDVTNEVKNRALIILSAIFPSTNLGERSGTSLMDSIWAEQRRSEALKLYYRVLESLCNAEAQILLGNNLTSILTNERFHRCMLACSAELVLATHKTVAMLFPAVLEKTGITAFDLSKVIETFIRHEDSLPRELRRHLNSLEERLLESMVWEKGSSMYNSLIVARPFLSSEISRLALLAEPMPSLDSIATHINFSSATSLPKHETSPGQYGEMRSPKRPCNENRSVLVERNISFTSPVKDRNLVLNNLRSKLQPPPLQSAFASPTRPSPGGGGETCAETAIAIFFSKINKLGAVRINGMVERLQLSQQMRESIYHLFQKILSHRTSLFFNRNIDQIILCCFYGVAKISQVTLTFKDIIYNYRRQPHCKQQVFRSVFVGWSSPKRSGPLLVEIGPVAKTTVTDRVPEVNNNIDAQTAQCMGSPKVSTFPSLPDMSPKKVSATHNVYVSPLRTSKMDALISHTSKSYYACVGESTHAYQSPSKDLTAINNRLNSTRKVRGTLNFDDADVGLVSDSMVASSLCLQNGNSASSSGTGTPVKSEQPDS
ncbi:hypothetical protein ACFE04_001785 [Oxalis oulophora]